MHLQTSRKVFESEVHARLVGRMLGIVYWVINITYLIKESLEVAEYYFRYLLRQDASTTEHIHMVETVLSCLVVAVIAIFFALENIVLLCKTFGQERSFLKCYVCVNCQNRKWRRIRLNQAVHVKECPPTKPTLQPMEVMNLKKNKDKNKAEATKKDQ